MNEAKNTRSPVKNGGKLHPETRLELSITVPHPQTRLNFPGFGRRFQEIEPHSRIPGKRSEIPDRELAKTLTIYTAFNWSVDFVGR
jgi:hypothetical protein